MKLPYTALPLLFACACSSTWAVSGEFFRVGEARRNEVRNAVAAHRAAQREEIRREEAAAGRRLTAAELFELRQQVRGQWMPPSAGILANSAESQPAERIVPGPMPATRLPITPSSQRH